MTSVRAARTAPRRRGCGRRWPGPCRRARRPPRSGHADLRAALAHQVAPGSERRTEVNSPHSQRNASPWSSRPRPGRRPAAASAGRGASNVGAIEARQRASSSAHRRGEDPGHRSAPARRASGVNTVAASGAERRERGEQALARLARRCVGEARRATRRRASGGSAPRGGACRRGRPAAPHDPSASASSRTASAVSYR